MAFRYINEYLTSGEVEDIKLDGVLPEHSALPCNGGQLAKVLKFSLTSDANRPSHTNGQLYFNQDNSTLMIQSSVVDVDMEVGHTLYANVVNDSGVIIEKGNACTFDGIVGGKISIKKAIATNFVDAKVFGLAATQIPIGGLGMVITAGSFRKTNTAGMPPGKIMYLSDTVAGTYSNIRPHIVSVVGSAITTDASTGVFYVKINNNVALPVTLGSLSKATSITNLPAVVATPVADYVSSVEIVTKAAKNTGVITPIIGGTYKINVSLHMSFDNIGGTGKKEFYLDIKDTTSDVVVNTVKGFLLKDTETFSMVDTCILDLVANHSYRAEIRSELALTNFTFSTSTFYIESILY